MKDLRSIQWPVDSPVRKDFDARASRSRPYDSMLLGLEQAFEAQKDESNTREWSPGLAP